MKAATFLKAVLNNMTKDQQTAYKAGKLRATVKFLDNDFGVYVWKNISASVDEPELLVFSDNGTFINVNTIKAISLNV